MAAAHLTPNKTLVFAKIPTAAPVVGEHLVLEDRPIDLTQDLEPNSLLVENLYISCDPYQRGRMRDASIKSYSPPYTIGAPIQNSTISRVLKSTHPSFPRSSLIRIAGAGAVAEFALVPAALADRAVDLLEPPAGISSAHYLGALGMPGLTAYSSFYSIAEPARGATIFISAASGAVGQLVGQLAKHEGMRVLGSVGSDAKLAFILDDLGFDGGFNYKTEDPAAALRRLAPDGIDVYYENVGGAQLAAALDALTTHGRVIACGMVSQYNLPAADKFGVTNLANIVTKQLKMQGFIVNDARYGPKYAAEHRRNLEKWLADGSFKATLDETVGIEHAGDALVGMLEGRNFGKTVIKVAAAP